MVGVWSGGTPSTLGLYTRAIFYEYGSGTNTAGAVIGYWHYTAGVPKDFIMYTAKTKSPQAIDGFDVTNSSVAAFSRDGTGSPGGILSAAGGSIGIRVAAVDYLVYADQNTKRIIIESVDVPSVQDWMIY